MGQTRFTPPDDLKHNTDNVRGLMLAAALKPESIALLLGATAEEAQRFKDEARGRMYELRQRVLAARRT